MAPVRRVNMNHIRQPLKDKILLKPVLFMCLFLFWVPFPMPAVYFGLVCTTKRWLEGSTAVTRYSKRWPTGTSALGHQAAPIFDAYNSHAEFYNIELVPKTKMWASPAICVLQKHHVTKFALMCAKATLCNQYMWGMLGVRGSGR